MRARRLPVHACLASVLPAALAASAAAEPPTIVAYAEDGVDEASYRTWNGTAWSTEWSTPALADDAKWIVLKNCPSRDETAMCGLGSAKDLYVAFFDGTSWGAATEICDDTEMHDERPYYLGYEQSSGDMLVAYWDKPDGKLGYRTYDGTTLSAESLLTVPNDKKLRWVTLYPKTGSDDILMLALNDDKDLWASLWDGTSWGAISTLETDTGYKEHECYAFVWESASGDGLATYGENGEAEPRYRTFISGTWSAEALLPSVGKKQRWHRLAADPASNEVLFASLDDDKDINVNVWDGAAWGTNSELETDVKENNRRQYDLAYEKGGSEALIMYVEKDQDDGRYRTWDGLVWSGEMITPDLGNKQQLFQLTTGTVSGEIFVLTNTDAEDLKFMKWDGTSLSAVTTLETSLINEDKTEPYMLAVPVPQGAPTITSWSEVEPE